jgi:predicted nucleic acid-binding protein
VVDEDRRYEAARKQALAALRSAGSLGTNGRRTWSRDELHAAAESGCDVCWTEDLNDGQAWRGVRVRNPFTSQ